MSFREPKSTSHPTARGLLSRLLSELSLASLLLVGCDVHGISAPGELASIRVSPNATLLAGATQQMTAVGFDAEGRIMGIAPAWSVAASGGVITGGGVFTAGPVTGLFANTVVASVGSIEGRASIIVIAGALATITVVPTPVTLTVLGTQQFTAVGRDVWGNIVPFTPTWSVIASGGSIDQAGMFTAGGTAGTFTNTVEASNNSIKGYATVIVTSGPVASIVVSPNPATLAVGTAQQFTAVAKDASGNVLAIPLVWSVAAGGGTIDATTGLFTAGNALGTYTNTVKATSGSVSGTATVTVVHGVLATITVTPNPATMLVNGTQQFEAVGRDALGNLFPSAPVWSVINGGGSIDTITGLFTAGTVTGTFIATVEARMGAVAGTATVTITTVPPVLTTITVTPNPQTLVPGGVQQFTAVGRDALGSVIAITPTWSIIAGGGTISGSGFFTAGGVAGTFAGTVVASSGSISGFATVIVSPAAQTITFAAPATPSTYGTSFTIAPTASSGLPVTVTPSGGCTMSGSTVTMTSGTAACVLTASQAGSAEFTAAPNVVQTVDAALRVASVTPTAVGKAFGAADPVLAGTLVGFLVGDAVTATYSRVSGEAVGTYVLSATLAPAGVLANYAITYNTALFTIGQVAQTITFAAPATPATYGSTFTIAPTASSGLTVTVTPSGGCTMSGLTVTMTSGATACVLTASQAGNGTYTAAPDVVQTVAAATRAASVTPTAAGKLFGAVDPALVGTLVGFLAGDNVTATYSRVAGEAVGTYVLSATLAPAGVLGNYAITYNTALFTIGQAAQTITFAAPVTPATYGSTFAIAPTASSGLTVTVTPSGGCTLSGSTVTMTSGTTACVLTASQAGNGTYTTAADVVQTVAAATLAASVTPDAAGKLFGAADPSPITTGTLVGFLAGDGVTATYARIAGEAVGTYVLSATLLPAGVLGNYAITYNTALFTIGQAAQAITFGALSARTYGDAPFVVSATGGASGNIVTFAASPAGVCTVSGTTVTLTGAGTCTVTASQAGSTNYSAAPDVVRTFTVAAGVQAVVTLTVPAAATVGEAGLTAVAGGGSGTGAFSYASTTPGVCTVGAASGAIAALTVGTCSLTAVRAADSNYLVSATSAAAAFTITKAAQAAVTVTVPSSATVGEAGLTAVAAGGSGTGAYSYASTTPSVCTVNAVSGSITALTVGSCGITATRAMDANYLVSATSAVSSFTIGLGASAAFAVLGGDGASSCTGASTIAGSVGVSASGSMSGFPAPCVTTAPGDAAVHLNDATAAAAQANVTTVYASLAGMTCPNDLTGQDLGTKNLAPGVYCFSSSAALTGTLTLTGPSDGVWVFKIGSTLTTAGAAQVAIVGGSAANVYWQVGSSATLGGTNGFRGNIIAQASITLGGATSLTGRALARTGAVTLDTNAITLP